MKHLRTGDPSVARRDPHARFSGIGTETGRPANRGLRPESHVARPGYRRRHRDRLSHATARRVEPQIEREPLSDDRLVVGRPARGRQRQHSDGYRVAAQRVALLALENGDPDRVGLRAARSSGAGGGAASMSRRAIGETAVASPAAALSTVTVSGGVAISRRPCRTRTGPITSVPGRWVLSRTSRVMVRTGPPTPSTVTSVTSREATIV